MSESDEELEKKATAAWDAQSPLFNTPGSRARFYPIENQFRGFVAGYRAHAAEEARPNIHREELVKLRGALATLIGGEYDPLLSNEALVRKLGAMVAAPGADRTKEYAELIATVRAGCQCTGSFWDRERANNALNKFESMLGLKP